MATIKLLQMRAFTFRTNAMQRMELTLTLVRKKKYSDKNEIENKHT